MVSFTSTHWSVLTGSNAPHAVVAQHQRSGRETVQLDAAEDVGAIVQSIDLRYYPELANSTVYFAMEAAVIPASKTAQLSLMIDVGNGLWQVISTADCNPAFVLARHSLDIPSWLSANLEKEGGESKLSAQLCRSPMQAQ